MAENSAQTGTSTTAGAMQPGVRDRQRRRTLDDPQPDTFRPVTESDVGTADAGSPATGAITGAVMGAGAGLVGAGIVGGPVGGVVGGIVGAAMGAAAGEQLHRGGAENGQDSGQQDAAPQARGAASQPGVSPEAREERLRALRERWRDLETQYVEARERNAQQLMSNLRGLMLSIKREIGRQGGKVPEFPYTPSQRRKMHLPPAA